jgi:hypothetical protein
LIANIIWIFFYLLRFCFHQILSAAALGRTTLWLQEYDASDWYIM